MLPSPKWSDLGGPITSLAPSRIVVKRPHASCLTAKGQQICTYLSYNTLTTQRQAKNVHCVVAILDLRVLRLHAKNWFSLASAASLAAWSSLIFLDIKFYRKAIFYSKTNDLRDLGASSGSDAHCTLPKVLGKGAGLQGGSQYVLRYFTRQALHD